MSSLIRANTVGHPTPPVKHHSKAKERYPLNDEEFDHRQQVRCQPSETILRSHRSISDLIHRLAIKEGTKVTSHTGIKNRPCSCAHSIHRFSYDGLDCAELQVECSHCQLAFFINLKRVVIGRQLT